MANSQNTSEAQQPASPPKNRKEKEQSSHEKEPAVYNKGYFWFMIFNTTLGFMNFGYSLSIFNSVLAYFSSTVFPDISDAQMSLIASITTIGAAFGAIVGGMITAKFGRRVPLIIGDFIFMIGAALTLVDVYGSMIAGRFIMGVFIGANTVISPLYIVEMSPQFIRGPACTLNVLTLVVGVFLSYLMGFSVPQDENPEKSENWRICFAIPIIIAAVRMILLCLVFRYDTPYYYAQKKEDAKMTKILEKIYKINPDLIGQSIKQEQQPEPGQAQVADEFTYKNLFTKYKKITFLGFFVSMVQMLIGINSVFIFSGAIFAEGLDDSDDQVPVILNSVLGIMNVLGMAISIKLVGKYGRRSLYMVSFSLVFAAMLAFAIIGYAGASGSWAQKILILVWPIAFNVGIGSLTYPYMSEILPDRALGIAVFLNWITSFLTIQFFLDISNAIEIHGLFLIHTAVAFVGLLVAKFLMIETKGKSKAKIIREYCNIKEEDIPQDKLEQSIKKDSMRNSIIQVKEAISNPRKFSVAKENKQLTSV